MVNEFWIVCVFGVVSVFGMVNDYWTEMVSGIVSVFRI